MPSIDLVDETYLVADPAEVATRLRDPALWRSWWPDLDLAVFQDRGLVGQRWTVCGALVGTSEVWLEPAGDGVILHYFLRADPTRRRSATQPLAGPAWRVRRAARRAARNHAEAFKQRTWALKDQLERGRAPGMPRTPAR